jgi:hypothetical protein
MTQTIEHSAHLITLIADGFDLDRRGFQTKAEDTPLFAERAIQNRILDLGHPPARAADEELPGVLILGPIAPQERVQRVEPMHEPGFLKEFQGSVNGRRGGLIAILGQLRQNLIGADRLVLAPHDLENASSQRGQVDPPRCAHLFSRRDRALNASRVVVRRSLSVYDSRHTALFDGPPRLARWTLLWGLRYSTGIYCNSSLDNRKCM